MPDRSELQRVPPATITIDAETGRPARWTIPRRYREVMQRRRRVAVVAFLIVAAGAWAGSALRPPVYRATGILEVRPESSDAAPVNALFTAQTLTPDYLGTQFGVLKSATLAERVVKQLNLGASPEFIREPLWRALVPERWLPREARDMRGLAEQFARSLHVTPQAGSRLVEVSFDAGSPELAATIANAVLDTYVGLRMEDAQRSASWLSDQLEQARKQLEASQHELQDYVREQDLPIIDTADGKGEHRFGERLKQLEEALTAVRANRYAKQSAYEQAMSRSQDASLLNDGPTMQSLSVRLADLRREAAGLASTFQEGYPRLKDVRSQIAAIERAVADEAHSTLGRSERDYRAAVQHEALLAGELAAERAKSQSLQSKTAGYAALKREASVNEQLYLTLNQKLKDVEIAAALRATNIGIVDRATPPLQRYGLSPATNIVLALVLSLVVAVGAAFAREHTDTSVRSVDDVGCLGVPALAAIPALAVKSRRQLAALAETRRPQPGLTLPATEWHRIDGEEEPASALAEAFAVLRTALLLEPGSPGSRAILVTSSQPGEGKTTVSTNLAMSMARLDRRVLLIDADLRRPSVHLALGLRGSVGLQQVLGGRAESTTRQRVLRNLDVITAGASLEEPLSPSELLSSPLMKQIIERAKSEYDFVIIDSPPFLAYPADVRILGELADGVLLTVRGGMTSRDAVWRSLSQLGRVIGVVLNGYRMNEAPPYYHPAYPARAAS